MQLKINPKDIESFMGAPDETERPRRKETEMQESPLPYAPLYNTAIEKLMLARDRVARDVLQVLAMRADPLGFCYPGVPYIAELAGYSRTTVEKALCRLRDDYQYIHIYEFHNPRRGKCDTDYQISPYVLYIADRDNRRAKAIALWEEEKLRNEIIHQQPTTESRIRNQNQEPKSGTNNNSPEGATARDYTNHSANGQERQNGKAKAAPNGARPRGRAAKTARSAKTPSPSSAAPPPLVPYDVALSDAVLESLADRMHAATRFTLSMANARGLVVQYGAARCEAALGHLLDQKPGDVEKPAGLLRTLIEQGRVDPARDGEHKPDYDADVKPAGKAYVNGRYSEFIQS